LAFGVDMRPLNDCHGAARLSCILGLTGRPSSLP
jgi:hypothetical protein